jgi:tetratricopeptide (TPR) repeat protein
MEYLTRGWSRLPKHPNEALADFRAASRLNPGSATALRQQVYVLSELLGDNEEALKLVTRATEMYPMDEVIRVHKAIIHARLGDRASALREAKYLESAQKDAKILFTLGRVYAITSQTHVEDRSKAILLLNRAFLAGFRRISEYETCKDLESLRNTTEFESFLVRIKGMLI